jgi:hypothetical protein
MKGFWLVFVVFEKPQRRQDSRSTAVRPRSREEWLSGGKKNNRRARGVSS